MNRIERHKSRTAGSPRCDDIVHYGRLLGARRTLVATRAWATSVEMVTATTYSAVHTYHHEVS
jgi:hypothetical protein